MPWYWSTESAVPAAMVPPLRSTAVLSDRSAILSAEMVPPVLITSPAATIATDCVPWIVLARLETVPVADLR